MMCRVGLGGTGLASRCRAGLARAPALARSVAPRARRQLCSTAKQAESAAESAAEGGTLKWLLKEGQIDSGFYQGAIMLGGVVGGTMMATSEQCTGFIESMIATYRACGLKEELINDKVLVEDFIRKNVLAAINVLMASPVFYFAFAKIMNEGWVVSTVRGVSGTLRIVPFMGFFYGFFAVVCPFVTQYFMDSHGQGYDEAAGNASLVVMLSGFVFIEALVELRGVGVTFAQMTVGSLVIFIPALIGRLATGVLTQQQKVGQTEHVSLLPEEWNDGAAPTWQQHTYRLFQSLALDKEFLVTCAGTSVFQHILNGISWVLLTRGKATGIMDITKFVFGGMQGTALSGLQQFGKTFVMRLGFSWAWNYATAMQLHLPAFDPWVPPPAAEVAK